MTHWADSPHLCFRCQSLTSGHRPDNPAYDRYCDACAVALMKKEAKLARLKRSRAAKKRNHPHLHPHPAHAAYLRKLAFEHLPPFTVEERDFIWLEAGLCPIREMTREEFEERYPSK